MAALRHFQWLTVPPNSYKNVSDDRIQRHARLLFVNASRPEAAEFLDRNLESLSQDPVCRNCFLYAAAYASGRPDLKDRAVKLLGKDIDKARFSALFDQLASFMGQGQGSMPESAAALLATMLADLKLDDSVWQGKIEEIFNQSYLGPERDLADNFIRAAKGEESLKQFAERGRRKSLAESLARLGGTK